jgi:hypothetical protein
MRWNFEVMDGDGLEEKARAIRGCCSMSKQQRARPDVTPCHQAPASTPQEDAAKPRRLGATDFVFLRWAGLNLLVLMAAQKPFGSQRVM